MKPLRDYQQDCMTCVLDALKTRAGTKVVAATGTGKGVLIGELVRRVQPARVMVLAHTNEIIWQLRDHIESQSGVECGVEMGPLRVNADLFRLPHAVVSTVQTQYSAMANDHKRMSRFRPEDWDFLICDEVHHFSADEFQNVVNYYCQNPRLKVVGFTATPKRHDQKSLPPQMEHTAFDFGIHKALEAGWLVEPSQQFIPVEGLDYSHVKTTAGDLDKGQLSQILEAEEIVQKFCHPTLEVIFGIEPHTLDKIPVPEWGAYLTGLGKTPRKTIVFTIRVQHAQACCNVLNRVIPSLANFVSGKTHPDDRENIFKDFASGKCPVLANVSVIGEGVDIPGAEVCVMARPTKSLTAYLQWIGRILRPLPGVVDGPPTPELRRAAIEASPKRWGRIVDFVGNSGRHKIVTSIDALGDGMPDEVKARALANILAKGKPVRVLRTMANAKNEVEQEKEREKRRQQELLRQRHEDELRRRAAVARAYYSVHDVSPFEGGVSTHWQKGSLSRYGKPISDKCKAILRARGYNPDRMTFGYAMRVIKEFADQGWPKVLAKKQPTQPETREIQYVPGPF